MKTGDLIDLLAAGIEPADGRAVYGRVGLALGAGVALAVAMLLALLRVRSDLGTALLLPSFWLKAGCAAGMAATGATLALRLARPGARVGLAARVAVSLVLALWLVAALVLASAAPAVRLSLLLGQTWRVCPWLIAWLSLPPLVAGLAAMRGLAPTRLRAAGFACGLTAGALGALVYCLHCPEDAVPFVAAWYVPGMLLPAALGAALGPRVLRW